MAHNGWPLDGCAAVLCVTRVSGQGFIVTVVVMCAGTSKYITD